MKVRIPVDDTQANLFLPANKPDGSGVGANYVDAYLKPLKLTLEDGRKLACKRRGLKLTLSIGERSGEGLLRRIEHGPDEKQMLREALREAARKAGAEIGFEDGAVSIDPDAGA